jgi:hypothetical protein
MAQMSDEEDLVLAEDYPVLDDGLTVAIWLEAREETDVAPTEYAEGCS